MKFIYLYTKIIYNYYVINTINSQLVIILLLFIITIFQSTTFRNQKFEFVSSIERCFIKYFTLTHYLVSIYLINFCLFSISSRQHITVPRCTTEETQPKFSNERFCLIFLEIFLIRRGEKRREEGR